MRIVRRCGVQCAAGTPRNKRCYGILESAEDARTRDSAPGLYFSLGGERGARMAKTAFQSFQEGIDGRDGRVGFLDGGESGREGRSGYSKDGGVERGGVGGKRWRMDNGGKGQEKYFYGGLVGECRGKEAVGEPAEAGDERGKKERLEEVCGKSCQCGS